MILVLPSIPLEEMVLLRGKAVRTGGGVVIFDILGHTLGHTFSNAKYTVTFLMAVWVSACTDTLFKFRCPAP